MTQPPSLQAGSRVAIVSTARKVQPTDVAACAQALTQQGYAVVPGPHLYAEHHQWAGTDADRLADLQWALDDPTIAAVVFARGGYGSSRIVDEIDWTKFVQRPKWLVGFSDLTALHAACSRQGVCSLHGPLAYSFGEGRTEAAALEMLMQVLAGARPVLRWPVWGETETLCNGRLMGGNLSLLAHLVGTPGEYDYHDAILFIEDLDEYRYHIDRMLVQLRRAGRLALLRGILVGSFTDLKDNPTPFGSDYLDIVQDAVRGYAVPVVAGLPVGHQAANYPLVVGAQVRVQVVDGQASLQYL